MRHRFTVKNTICTILKRKQSRNKPLQNANIGKIHLKTHDEYFTVIKPEEAFTWSASPIFS